MRRFSQPSPVADIELLESVKGSGLAPAVELSAPALYVAGCGLDEWEVEATGGARVVGEDPGDENNELALLPGEGEVGDEVEGRGAPQGSPPAGDGLRAGSFLGGKERDDGAEDGVGDPADEIGGALVGVAAPCCLRCGPMGFPLVGHGRRWRCGGLHGRRLAGRQIWPQCSTRRSWPPAHSHGWGNGEWSGEVGSESRNKHP